MILLISVLSTGTNFCAPYYRYQLMFFSEMTYCSEIRIGKLQICLWLQIIHVFSWDTR
jgi:hypothetical protein